MAEDRVDPNETSRQLQTLASQISPELLGALQEAASDDDLLTSPQEDPAAFLHTRNIDPPPDTEISIFQAFRPALQCPPGTLKVCGPKIRICAVYASIRLSAPHIPPFTLQFCVRHEDIENCFCVPTGVLLAPHRFLTWSHFAFGSGSPTVTEFLAVPDRCVLAQIRRNERYPGAILRSRTAQKIGPPSQSCRRRKRGCGRATART
jgi:hypothetical protein